MILYLDIETATQFEAFEQMSEHGQQAFKKKFQWRVDNGMELSLHDIYAKEANLYAEFGKIICIGVGTIMYDSKDENKPKIYVKVLTGDEKQILEGFLEILTKVSPDTIAAHNGKTFDFPYLSRRMMINGFAVPEILNPNGKKKWEMPWSDTNEIWQFGDYKYYTSLVTLSYALGIPSPKGDLDGSKVNAAFYRGEIDRIKSYCAFDIVTLVRIDRKLKYLEEITDFIVAAAKS